MSKVAHADVSISVSLETGLLDMPYEILFEMFRSLPKCKLIEISKLCPKFRDIAGDTRLWKNVCIRYKPHESLAYDTFAFEELYSEPWPVNVVDLSETHIGSPVSSKCDQVVKVNKLYLSPLRRATKVTMEAILAKYQCTEIYLDNNNIDDQGRIMGMSPETFSKQNGLEVLSLTRLHTELVDFEKNTRSQVPCHEWLEPILSNCKNLKTLDLTLTYLTSQDMLGFVKKLPTSLEKLVLLSFSHEPEDSFFGLLAEITPNLKELHLFSTSTVKCPSLLKLNVLETLHVIPKMYQDVSDLYMYIKKFPTLKTVNILRIKGTNLLGFKKLRKTLEPHDIIVSQQEFRTEQPYPEDRNLWEVSKAM